jgi:hypothetical protein
MIVGSYSRNLFTMVSNQVGQVVLRHYVANLFSPFDIDAINKKLDEEVAAKDAKKSEDDDEAEDGPEVVMAEVPTTAKARRTK